MDESILNELVRVSRRVGRWELAQAGGGNTSIKRGDRLTVKASGLRLRDIDASGFVDVDIAWLRDRVRHGRDEPIPSPGLRPSIETWMHALLDDAMVHTHPIAVNAFLCADVSESGVDFDRFDPIVIPYVTPGFPLACALAREADRYHASRGRWPEVVLLENHGLITCARTLEDAATLTERVVTEAGAIAYGELPSAEPEPDLSALAAIVAGRAGLPSRRVCASRRVTAACHDERGRSWFCDAPLFPDQVVYCGPSALWMERGDDVEAAVRDHESRVGVAPQVIAMADAGVVIAASSSSALDAAEEVLTAHIAVSMMGAKLGALRRLSAEHVAYLMGWEAEKYRQSLNRNLS